MELSLHRCRNDIRRSLSVGCVGVANSGIWAVLNGGVTNRHSAGLVGKFGYVGTVKWWRSCASTKRSTSIFRNFGNWNWSLRLLRLRGSRDLR